AAGSTWIPGCPRANRFPSSSSSIVPARPFATIAHQGSTRRNPSPRTVAGPGARFALPRSRRISGSRLPPRMAPTVSARTSVACSRTASGTAPSGVRATYRARAVRTGSIAASAYCGSAGRGPEAKRLAAGEGILVRGPGLAGLLVRDLEHVPVGIVEVDRQVRTVVHGQPHGNPVRHERGVKRLEVLLSLDLPGHVEQPDLLRRRGSRVRPDLPEAEVVRVRVPGYRKEHHATREPPGDGQAEHARVERLGPVEIAHLEDHVAKLLEHHGGLPREAMIAKSTGGSQGRAR